MSNLLVNFSSGVGKRDTVLLNGPMIDTSAVIGPYDISLNNTLSQSVEFTTQFTTSSPTMGNGISLSGWFFPTGAQNIGNTLFAIRGDKTSVSLFYKTANTLSAYYNGVVLDSSWVITPNTWHFFCYTIYCTYATTALQTLYIDPSRNSNYNITNNDASYVAFNSTGNNFVGYGVGKDISGLTYSYFNGKINDFRFYNRVLTPFEINVLYEFTNASVIAMYVNQTAPSSFPSVCNVTSTTSTAYDTAVQIGVSGTFSGLKITRTPNFTSTPNVLSNLQYNPSNAIYTPGIIITAKDLVSYDGMNWYYIDTTVTAGNTYSYSITPFIPTGPLNIKYNVPGNTVTVSGLTTVTLQNGNYTTLITGSLPASGAYLTAPQLSTWTFVPGSGNYYLCNGKGTAEGINLYTGFIPFNVTNYLSLAVPASSSFSFSQRMSLYQTTQGKLTFYAWTADSSYNSTLQLSVSLGASALLNAYPITTSTAGPVTSFTLPVNMPSSFFSAYLTFNVTNTSTTAPATLCISPVKMTNAAVEGTAYAAVDPSFLSLYYPMDAVNANGNIYNYASGTGVLDGTIVNANIQAWPTAIIGKSYLYTNGTANSFAKLGSWTCPTRAVGNGFSIACWVRPSIPVSQEPSGAAIFSLSNTTGGRMSLYLRPGGVLDFSCNRVRGVDVSMADSPILYGKWSFFTMTCAYRSDGSGVYTYYVNDICMSSVTGTWPDISSSYTSNYLGGVPSSSFNAYNMNILGGTPTATTIGIDPSTNMCNFYGYIDDFRVYNRVLTANDIFSLWSLGQTGSSQTGVTDPTGMNMYYSFD